MKLAQIFFSIVARDTIRLGEVEPELFLNMLNIPDNAWYSKQHRKAVDIHL